MGAVVVGAGLPLIVGLGTTPALAGSLSNGALTMVSTRADGTAGPALPTTFGADQEAISEDGKVIAFVSPIPAEQLVTDPIQTSHVTDTNGESDVFVWDSRVPAPIGPIVSLVSWNKDHNATADAKSEHPILAPAGLGIVFESGATNLVTVPVGSFSKHLYAWAPVVNELFPVFMVDENYAGTSGSDSLSSDASIAVTAIPPAAKVAFTSSASDLVDPAIHDSHGLDQVYVRTFTLPTPSTEMASVDLTGDGTVSGARDSMISADGIHVVFASGGDSLVNGVAATGSDIFVRNLFSDSTSLISKADGSTQGTSGNGSPAISADGNTVAWDGNDTNLSPTTHNGNNHIFYRSGVTDPQMVDTNYTGVLGCNSASNNPGLSLDGTTVVFESFCSDIVPPTVSDDSGTDVFTRRMSMVPFLPDPAPKLVSINDAGTASGNADSFICPGTDPPHCGASTNPGVTVSADGSSIAFFSDANDIAKAPNSPPPFSNGNVFVRYPDALMGGKTVNVTINGAAKNPDGTSRDPVISADGGSVAFVSLADDLVIPDGNQATDVFESDLHNTFTIQPVTAVSEGDGTVTVTVLRTGSNGTTDTVGYETVDGIIPDIPIPVDITDPLPATQPDDYTMKSGTLTFAPGDTTKTVTIDITDDATAEQLFEVFRVSLKDPTGAGSLALPGPLNQAYVGIIDDDGPAQDWHVAIDTEPPASADVGDSVPVTYSVSTDMGTDDLAVSAVASGAGTNGLDSETFPGAVPFAVAAGATVQRTGTARLVGTPGSTTNHLEIAVTAALGAGAATTKSVSSSMITSNEAVTATLMATDDGDGNAATVGLPDKVTYTLQVTNGSDTAAQTSGLPSGFAAPAGTTESSRTDGTMAIAANSSSTWTLVADVDDTGSNGSTFTETPTGVQYAMTDVALASRPVAVTPMSFTSTLQAPVIQVGPHTLTDVNGGNLEAGDVVDVSVTVKNTGDAAATVTLVDALGNLDTPIAIEVDGVACGTCTSSATSVTAPLGSIAGGAMRVLTFSATVPANPAADATSSAVVTFAPATTGTSPTTADVATTSVTANTAPIAVADSYATDEDVDLTVPLLAGVLTNDTDPDADTLSASLVSQASAHGQVVLAADGSFSYQPDADFNGAATFTYTVNDGTADSNVATVTIDVAPVNDPANLVDDAVVATSGEQVMFDVLANDSDVDGDTLTVSHTDVNHGTLTCASDGKCAYQPDSGYVGPDSFTYTVDDGQPNGAGGKNRATRGVSGPATVTIDVQAATTTTTSSTTSTTSGSTTTTSVGTTTTIGGGVTTTTATGGTTTTGPGGTGTTGPGGTGTGGTGTGGAGNGSGNGSGSGTGGGTLVRTGAPNTIPTVAIGTALVLLGGLVLGLRRSTGMARRTRS
ncbi:MAG: outer rane adhesin like protein [Acidimicrobiales bacterium]|nr:outer rane adhesin like protein [Acidimicrobiales bacterium]